MQNISTIPPTSSRRMLAEWEEQSAILLAFPHKNSDWEYCIDEIRECFCRIIALIIQFEPVLICVDTRDKDGLLLLYDRFANTKAESFELSPYTSIQLSKDITLAFVPTNDVWARDFGAISVESKPHTLYLLDFVFNGWGLKFAANFDNQITKKLHEMQLLQGTLESLPFVLEGGSIDTDGCGSLLTTSACLLESNRNQTLNKRDIEQMLCTTLGVSRVLWLDFGYLEGDDTDSHIDMLARFVAKDTIAYIGCDDKNDIHYEPLRAMEQQLQSFRDVQDSPYKLIRLPFVRTIYDENGARLPASYANFLFVNGALLVPTYNDPNDTLALKLLAQALPHLKVLGVDARDLIKWHGSLHCISMQLYK